MRAMTHADLLKRLLPPVAYDPNAPVLGVDLGADGNALDATLDNAVRLLDEADPRITSELLGDFERVLGLPDKCSGTAPATVAQRRTRVLDKLLKVRGQSRQYYLDLAARLGYTGVSITEFRPMACGDPCDSTVYGDDWRFVWQVNTVNALPIHVMACGDPCNSPLRSWRADELQCRLNILKPAHTLGLINFGAV